MPKASTEPTTAAGAARHENDTTMTGNRDIDPGDRTGWDATLYDTSHHFVYEYGSDLISLLDPAAAERILDLGCGTGHLTDEIGDQCAEIVGLDNAASMIEEPRRNFPERTPVRRHRSRKPTPGDAFRRRELDGGLSAIAVRCRPFRGVRERRRVRHIRLRVAVRSR